jgi:glycosyltransferase involved in cell wall biosynthesis
MGMAETGMEAPATEPSSDESSSATRRLERRPDPGPGESSLLGPRPRITGPRVQRNGHADRTLRSPRVSVIIPTLNEAKNLPHVFMEMPGDLHEVIIVDGLSTDGTPDVALELMPEAKIVFQEQPGKGAALRCGFEAATGDVIVMLDADGSADPAEIPAFVAALLDGADFAKGTRFCEGGGSADITRLRRAGNHALSRIVNVLFGAAYSDLCYGYNAFWRHCLPAMSVDCSGFEVETLINIRIARAGLVVREVPSFERDRIHGESNLRTFRDGGRVLRTIVRERLRRSPDVQLAGTPHVRHSGANVHQGEAATVLSPTSE